MSPLLPVLITLPLAVFYLWMFYDMLHNPNLRSSPWAYLGVGGYNQSPQDMRYNWALALLFLNVVGAMLYYFAEYRQRR